MSKRAQTSRLSIAGSALATFIFTNLAMTSWAMGQERIRISSEWGNVKAELVDNEATRALLKRVMAT